MTNQNDCEKRQEALMALVLGELEASVAEELQEHVRTCETCRHFHDRLVEKEKRIESAFGAIACRAQDMRGQLLGLLREQLSQEHDLGARLPRGSYPVHRWSVAKVAAAAAVICFAYIVGLLTSSKPPDLEQLCSDVTTAVQPYLTREIDDRVQKRLQAARTELKDELQQQVRRDLTEFATKTLLASTKLTDQRLMELAELIDAARRRERSQVVAAMEQMEIARLQETHMLRSGLETLAQRTSESVRPGTEE